MRKAIVTIFIAILIYLIFFADPACTAVSRGKFQSMEEKSGIAQLPMSDTEPGIYYKYPSTITFRYGSYTQQEDDFFITGYYVCKLGKIVARSSLGDSISGDYNPSSGILLWNGELYQQNSARH